MIHKARFAVALALLLGTAPSLALAERRSVLVTDSSSTGRLVRISLGAAAGLAINGPVLFSENDRKLAAGRVVRLSENTAVVAVLESYGDANPVRDSEYELLYGEPFPEAANLPPYVVDRESEKENPANERFFMKAPNEASPDLDDDGYTPEMTLRPRLPDPRNYSPHNITIGAALFRNRLLPTEAQPDIDQAGKAAYTTYSGFVFRYAYSFRTNYWFKTSTPALMSIEAMFGIYNFDHTFPATSQAPQDRTAHIRIFTPGFNVRYMFEVNKFFRLYPYAGFIYNLATAETGNAAEMELINGGRLLGGVGAQLVISETMDARVDVGSDGLMGGLVVKF